MKKAFIIILLVLLLFPVVANAATCGASPDVYYVDFVGGNDANDGTSTAAAWQHAPGDEAHTWHDSCTLQAGDVVIFKGGVTYTGGAYDSHGVIRVQWSGSGDADANRIIYDGDSGTYAARWAAGTDKAKIDGNGVANSIFGLNADGSDYITINNFEITNVNGTPAAVNAAIWAGNTNNYLTVSNCLIHDTGYYDETSSVTELTLATGTQTLTVETGKPYVAGQSGRIQYNSTNLMTFSVSSYNSETGVLVVTVGADGVTGSGTYSSWTVSVYGGAAAIVVVGSNAKITGCTIYDTCHYGIKASNGSGSEIASNTLYGKMTWPLTYEGNDGTDITGSSIHDNILYNIGKDFLTGGGAHQNWIYVYTEKGGGAGTEDGAFINLSIYNNKLYNNYAPPQKWGAGFLHLAIGNTAGTGQWSGLYIYNNVMFNGYRGGATGIDISFGYAGSMSNIYIYGNSFWESSTETTGPAINIMLAADDLNATNLYIKNNILQNDNSRVLMNIPAKSQVTGTYEVDYNNYYTAGSKVAGIGVYGSVTTYSFANWQSTVGFDLNGKNVDPKYTSVTPASFDLSLQSDSGVIGAGVDLGASYNTDILGVSRPQGAAWDIGAYEYPAGGGADYTVTPSVASGSGTISPDVGQLVASGGDSPTFTATPANGWKVTWSGTCGATGSAATYQKTGVDADCTVIATFSEIKLMPW